MKDLLKLKIDINITEEDVDVMTQVINELSGTEYVRLNTSKGVSSYEKEAA